MRGQSDTRLFSHGNDFFQKALQPAPKFFARDGRQAARRRMLVIDHIPYGSIWNGQVVQWTVHSDRDRATPAEWAGDTAANPTDAEVIAKNGNACLSHTTNDGLYILNMLRPLGTIEQNVVPECGINILDHGQDKTGIFNFSPDSRYLTRRPQTVRIACDSPRLILAARWLIVARVGGALLEIIHQMDHEMSATRLPREIVVITRKHVTVES